MRIFLVVLLCALAGCRSVNITVHNESGTVNVSGDFDVSKEVGVSPEIKVPLIP